jgi:hypothetical protein
MASSYSEAPETAAHESSGDSDNDRESSPSLTETGDSTKSRPEVSVAVSVDTGEAFGRGESDALSSSSLDFLHEQDASKIVILIIENRVIA